MVGLEYNKGFYEEGLKRFDDTNRKAANIIGKFVKGYVCKEAKSIIDFGCHVGIFIDEFKSMGYDVTGVDGDWMKAYPEVILPSVHKNVIFHNLEKPFEECKYYDAVLSLETAENIKPGTEEVFIHNLTRSAKEDGVIVFSAARYAQDGWKHTCLHHPTYWMSLLKFEGWTLDVHESNSLSKQLTDAKCNEWYINNIGVFYYEG